MTEQTPIADPLDDVLHGRTRAYVQSILTPDNPFDRNALSQDQREERAAIFAELYGKGHPLSQVAVITGLSKARIGHILRDYGYELRPAPGTRAYREQREKQQREKQQRAETPHAE